MPVVWVTGSPGVGKSTVCALLKCRGELAFDADLDGYNQWVDRASGQVVADPACPVPAIRMERFAWRISRVRLEVLAARTPDRTAFVCGVVENEVEVWDLFDLVICLVANDETLRHRLSTRTTNTFGKHPDELALVLGGNDEAERTYRRRGATIIDGTRPLAEVADAILAAAARLRMAG